MSINSNLRAFKTARFSKDAKKAKITDVELCQAIEQVLLSQVDDLGGGVFKKRLNDNLHRSIILAKGGKYWVFEYLFAKKDRSNIENDELLAFRLLANSYAGLTQLQVNQLLLNGDLWRFAMTTKQKFKSDAFAAIHASAAALQKVGAIDQTTMRQFDVSCLAVPPTLAPSEIKHIREQAHVSQPVFARYLNTSESTVQKWESGSKQPSGMALKLLAVVQKHGLGVLA
jgi:putative transcriptional regulator